MTTGSRRERAPATDARETRFLNVDLDVFASSPLEPLAAAFGNRVTLLFVGRRGNRFRAHFELRASPRMGADALIAGFVRLVDELSTRSRAIWNRAYRRDFNIGIQAGFAPYGYELHLKPETLRLASSVRARVVVTIYAAITPRTRRAHR